MSVCKKTSVCKVNMQNQSLSPIPNNKWNLKWNIFKISNPKVKHLGIKLTKLIKPTWSKV